MTTPPHPGYPGDYPPLVTSPIAPMFPEYLASGAKRVVAAAIDVTVIIVGAVATTVGATVASGNPASTGHLPLASAAALGLGIAVAFGGPNLYLLLCWRGGQTVGMRALGIQVVSVAGGPITTGQAILRLAGAYWSVTLAGAGFVMIAADSRRRGLHDRMAGSRVIEAVHRSPYGAPWQKARTAPPDVAAAPPPPGFSLLPPGVSEAPVAPPRDYPQSQAYPQPPGYAPLPEYQQAPGHRLGPGYAAPEAIHPDSARAFDAPSGDRLLSQPVDTPDPDAARRGWRSPATWRRSPWTWTDVVPVIALFIPLLTWTDTLLAWVRRAVQPTSPTGVTRGIELVVLDAVGYSGCLLLLFLVVRGRRGAGLRALGLGPVPVRWLAVSVPALLFALALESATGLVSNSLFPGTPNAQCTGLKDVYAGYLPVAILVVSVFAPLVEETFFRGFLLRYLRDRLPWGVALLISAAIFSAGHYSWGQPTIFLPIFCAGLVLGALYLWSGSVWPGVITHGLFNLIPVLILFVGNRGCP